MQLLHGASRLASVALLLFPLNTHADTYDIQSANNLTLRFFQESQEDTCSFRNSSGALTFTTSTVPFNEHCFEIDEIFGGNTTQGFVNQTLISLGPSGGMTGIFWAVENADLYSPGANYTSVLYHLRSMVSGEPGELADRRLQFYPAKGCHPITLASNITGISEVPWYGYSCWSEEEGYCGTIPYGISSFRLMPAFPGDNKPDQCMIWAEWGAASSLYSSSRAVVGAAISASLAIWLAW